MKNYIKICKALTKNGFFVPGNAHGVKRSFWTFPLIVPNRMQFRDFLQEQGVFCIKSTTQVNPVKMPEHRREELGETTQINQMFKQIVYLPVHNLIPEKRFEVLVNRVVGASLRYQSYIKHTKQYTEFRKWP